MGCATSPISLCHAFCAADQPSSFNLDLTRRQVFPAVFEHFRWRHATSSTLEFPTSQVHRFSAVHWNSAETARLTNKFYHHSTSSHSPVHTKPTVYTAADTIRHIDKRSAVTRWSHPDGNRLAVPKANEIAKKAKSTHNDSHP